MGRKEGDCIKCLFWNLKGKNLFREIAEAVKENELDVIVVAEGEGLDIPSMIDRIKSNGRRFEQRVTLQEKRGLKLIADSRMEISVYREESRYMAYKIRENGKRYLLIVVHLDSAMYLSETARNLRASELSRMIEKIENNCRDEEYAIEAKEYKTIIVGDFNLQPFSAGIIGKHGFNAVMDEYRAKKANRRRDDRKHPVYFNPMWNLMGKRGQALGTYYRDSDQDDNLFYWYTIDQVLLRPELIDDFVWDEFEILEQIGDNKLIVRNKIDKKRYSDHLPIKFEVR